MCVGITFENTPNSQKVELIFLLFSNSYFIDYYYNTYSHLKYSIITGNILLLEITFVSQIIFYLFLKW